MQRHDGADALKGIRRQVCSACMPLPAESGTVLPATPRHWLTLWKPLARFKRPRGGTKVINFPVPQPDQSLDSLAALTWAHNPWPNWESACRALFGVDEFNRR